MKNFVLHQPLLWMLSGTGHWSGIQSMIDRAVEISDGVVLLVSLCHKFVVLSYSNAGYTALCKEVKKRVHCRSQGTFHETIVSQKNGVMRQY